ncbi:MAG: DEAD/DEAH box helicase [archaeon]
MAAAPKKEIEAEKKLPFTEMKLPDFIQKALAENGFTHASPIQEHAIPLIQEGNDLLGQAKTGTGKTAAFGIPILSIPASKTPSIHAIVIVPTRELALQVRDELENIGKYSPHKILAIFGGASMTAQADALRRKPGIIVGTPGRVQDFMRQGKLDISHVKTVILDEADKMLDMGFKDDIEAILSQTPSTRQTLLFSATMPSGIKQLAKKHLKDPKEVNLSEDTLTVEGITQYYLNVDPRERVTMLLGLIQHFKITKGIVFCSTKRTVDWLENQLQKRRMNVAKLHGDLPQGKRQRFLQDFEEGNYPLLLATNVAARGIHIENITHVINFDFPDEYETYVHRVGRTARQGKKRIANTFVTNVSDVQRIGELEILMNSKIHELKVK